MWSGHEDFRLGEISGCGINRTRFEMEQLAGCLELPGDCIVYASGRSYGDSALNERVIFSSRFDKILDFDPSQGIVTCESGVTLAEIIEAFLPRGWFPSVTPGTRFISVGGAIAGDVHGKNHHKIGCFSECVLSFDLMLPGGEVVPCSRERNSVLFHASCGGMGLTGIILAATFRLQRVKSAWARETVIRCGNLEEVLRRFEKSRRHLFGGVDRLPGEGGQAGKIRPYARGARRLGRLTLPREKPFSLPFNSPGFLLNRHSVGLFNHFYHNQPDLVEGRLTPLNAFFYPLDGIGHWNRMYGKRGFTQYQLVLPKDASRTGLEAVLGRIADAGLGSFLAVLKLFGAQNANWLSFPMEGYTLALDFKIENRLFPLLDELDRIVLDHGGRIYLSKDVRMRPETFRRGYPRWEEFAELRERRGMIGKFNSLQSKRLGV